MRPFDLSVLPGWWPYAIGAVLVVIDAIASVHAIIRKRDVRAAIAWAGLIWVLPGIGAILYATLGHNRIQRRAVTLQRERRLGIVTPSMTRVPKARSDVPVPPGFSRLARLGARMSGRPLLEGNRVTPFQNGDEAYPAMLAAIERAQSCIAMASFIFGDDEAGHPFVEALARARKRGVEVRVLVDGAGLRYTWPTVNKAFKAAGVPFALFLPRIRDAGLGFFNLRNHRKVLTVDGQLAFTGGMNVARRNLHALNLPQTIRDLHFRVEGPIVAQLQEAFAEDWAFTTREVLDGPRWYPELEPVGDTTARIFTDGPDGDIEILRTVLLGALALARDSVRIITPYFLPDQAMVAALAVTALRGVKVDIILPEHVNIKPVQWASTAQMWQVLRPGCHIYQTPLPFEHTKLMVVDQKWALFGSSNWDPRSLRLNFELDVECYDPALARQLDEYAASRIATAHEVTLAEVDGRPLWKKLRDSTARLFSPFL